MLDKIYLKRVVHNTKDVFKVPLTSIKENTLFQTREKNEAFVGTILQSMKQELNIDTIVYLVTTENPLKENGNIKEIDFCVLGGTHYLSALKMFHEGEQSAEVNAAIFCNLTEEETVWLGIKHNCMQHQCRKLSSKEYIINFRRLLLETNIIDKEPPINPPKDWRLKCQGLLPIGKNINSYSPWLAISKCQLSTWKLVVQVFTMYEKGEIKGTKKVGLSLESHRLWRVLTKLEVAERERVLGQLVERKFSIGDAIEDAENRQKLEILKTTIGQQVNMSWEDVAEKYGSRVSSDILMPYARLDNVECVPVILHEFIEDLKDDNSKRPFKTIWKRGEDMEICLLNGTPFSPPDAINSNVILLEMTSDDDSYRKDEIRLIITKTSNYMQRQLFIVFTEFQFLPELVNLAGELNFEHETVILQSRSNFKKQKLTDNVCPVSVQPVLIIKKVTSAVPHMYNFPVNEQITNFFEEIEDLLNVCVFPSDTVMDTTLNVEVAKTINCKELLIIASDKEIECFKEKLSSANEYEEIALGSSQSI